MKPAVFALAFGAVAAAFALRQAATATALDAATDAGDGLTALDYVNPWGAMERQADAWSASSASADDNVRAFLALIAYSEGTDRAADPYRVCYGYRHTIADLSEHPAVSGEWKGEALDKLGPAYVGKVSTAAGRYQIIRPTWLAVRRELGLVDFGPTSQDLAAIHLVRKRGALDLVKAGQVADAVAKCRQEWASLPGAGYGQPERQMAALVNAFEAAGGTVA